jgi:hypothetical protein
VFVPEQVPLGKSRFSCPRWTSWGEIKEIIFDATIIVCFFFFWKGGFSCFKGLSLVEAFTKQNMSSNHPSLKEKNVKLLKEVDEVGGVCGLQWQ